MPRGGSRSGAGRKKGKANTKTRERVAKAEAGGIMPVDLMLFVMRERFKAKDYTAAADIAKDVAPYLHRKLASVQHTGPDGGPVQLQIVEEIVDAPGAAKHSKAAPGSA